MATRLTLEQAEELAREATRVELERYDLPDGVYGNVALTTLFEGDERIFVLYVPGKERKDAFIVAKTKVNLENGNVEVSVPGLPPKN